MNSFVQSTCRGSTRLFARATTVNGILPHRSIITTRVLLDSKNASTHSPPPLFPDPKEGFPQTGFEVKPPLRWPVDDMATRPAQELDSDFPAMGTWKDIQFDKTDEAPLGDYPRDVPRLWPQWRDPYYHWDKQARREFGEVVPDDFNFMDPFSPGVMVDWKQPAKQLMGVVGFFVLGWFTLAWYDPEGRREAAPRDYPFDGLRLELGGDPNDPTDNANSARVFKLSE